MLEPRPCSPRSDLCSGLKRKWTKVLWLNDEVIRMSPPWPPSPPEGPPRGTNFSRRKAMQPLPPSPAFTRIFASSINIFVSRWQRTLVDLRVSGGYRFLDLPRRCTKGKHCKIIQKPRSLVPKARLVGRTLLNQNADAPAPRNFRAKKRYSTSMGSTIANLPIDPLFRNLMRPVT